ncbi:XRE family transcriptional regulator [Paenibacillus anaericanus]|uniref:XRE family transcriptional regulator n=1 Tax=Paenibacillus anaericanus TaxID=170367 RepID=A0A3S1BS97_9BACL|nr:helix-turn-helix transcriptional regulator [Paenibacillus anaericanus]RUT48572.1 XRE family transcriptional regulator [Paenibacillus anaericanus]
MLPVYAKRLKEARLKAKLTQVEVRQNSGINNKTLSGYENGVSEPDYETLKVLCDLYGVTTDWVLGNTNNPHSELTKAERDLAGKVILGDDSFVDVPIEFEGRMLTNEEKIKLQELAKLILRKDS